MIPRYDEFELNLTGPTSCLTDFCSRQRSTEYQVSAGLLQRRGGHMCTRWLFHRQPLSLFFSRSLKTVDHTPIALVGERLGQTASQAPTGLSLNHNLSVRMTPGRAERFRRMVRTVQPCSFHRFAANRLPTSGESKLQLIVKHRYPLWAP